MVRRATIADVAEAAGVSVATVNRVLGGGAPVRPDTAERVRAAAETVGFHAAGLIRSRTRRAAAPRRIGVLLQRPDEPFYNLFGARLREAVEAAAEFRGTVAFEYWHALAPDEIAACILRLARRSDALALVTPDHPAIADAIAETVARSIPVFALLSDCAPAARTAYIGVDNRRAGRTAAWALANCAAQPGKIAVFVGSHRFHGHELREIGLRSYFREHAPDFPVLETMVNGESPEATEAMLGELMEREAGLVGCYLAGGGTAGAMAVMRRLPPERRLAVVCNDAPPIARPMLTERLLAMTVAERLDGIGAELVAALAKSSRPVPAAIPGQIFVPFDLITPENV